MSLGEKTMHEFDPRLGNFFLVKRIPVFLVTFPSPPQDVEKKGVDMFG